MFRGVFRIFLKFLKIHRKTPAAATSLKKRIRHRGFPTNTFLEHFLVTASIKTQNFLGEFFNSSHKNDIYVLSELFTITLNLYLICDIQRRKFYGLSLKQFRCS